MKKAILLGLMLSMLGGCTYMRGNTYKAVKGQDNLSRTAEAIETAELDKVLADNGPYTLFAPNDAAWNQLPEGQYYDLLKPENRQQLREILMYHVASGKFMAEDLKSQQQLNTLSGDTLDVGVDYGQPTVDGILVVEQNIETTNGVIHVIDRVLRP
jgi:uncharacterized surface protein with fasciclin (FAS1) repeats